MEKNIEIKSVIERVKAQLDEFYKGNNWVTDNFNTKVLSLKEDEALMKMHGFSHSIAGLVWHIIAWRNFVVQKLTGNEGYDIDDKSTENWNEQQDWEMVCKQFKVCHQNILDAIDNFPIDRWNEKVAGRNYSFIYLICGIIQHDYYHYGQIGSLLAAIKKIS